jgi:hypothetical protein
VALANNDLAAEELRLLRLALEESRAAHDALLHQQQVTVNATPGASTSRSARANTTAPTDTSRARVASPSSDSPPPVAPVAPAPTQGGGPPPIVGVGAPRFIEFPKRKTQQTIRKIRAGLGAGKSALWREMNVRQSVTVTHV